MEALVIGGLLLAAEKLPGSCCTPSLLVRLLLAGLQPSGPEGLQLGIFLPRKRCTPSECPQPERLTATAAAV